MKHAKQLIFRSALAVAVIGTFSACEGIGLCDLTEDDVSMGDSFIETTSYFMNTVGRVDEAMRDQTLQMNGSTTIDGANVTRDNDSIVIDFGSTDVLTADGKLRRGKLVGQLNGDYFVQQGSIELVLRDYFVDYVQVTGSITLTNNGVDPNDGSWDINLASSNFAIGDLYTYNANLTMEWSSGFETDTINDDDVFELYGSAGGTDVQDTIEFTTAFTQPMLFDRSCEFVVKAGIVDVTLVNGTATLASVQCDFIDNDGINADGCNNTVMLNAACDETTVNFPQTFDGF